MIRADRWHLPAAAAFVTLLAVAGWDCTGEDAGYTAVPRPTAYPRIQTYAPAYSDTEFPEITIEANDSTVYDRDFSGRNASGLRWISIHYPAYNATIYCTYSPVTAVHPLSETLSNREERMALNSGGATSTVTDFRNAYDISCRIVVTPYGTVTPVQFIATDSSQFVVSGALHLKGIEAASTNDSIQPIVDAVEADVMHMLENLHIR